MFSVALRHHPPLQLELARAGHGAYSVSWKELLIPQAWDILSSYNIQFSKDYSLNKLAALLVRSPRFTPQFGKTLASLTKFVKFDFDIGNPWTPISISKIPSNTSKPPSPSKVALQPPHPSDDCKECLTYVSDGIECSECRSWVHEKCTGLTKKQFTAFTAPRNNNKWLCKACAACKKPKVKANTKVKPLQKPSASQESTSFTSSIPPTDDVPPSPTLSSRIVWGNLRGDQIKNEINEAYREVILWKPNLFKVPSGQTGEKFIDELARTVDFFKRDSHLEPIALTAVITMMPLLLQKPSKTSKISDHIKYLKERLELWRSGNLTKLIRQGRAIQKPLLQTDKPPTASSDKVIKTFTRLMLLGKISSAVKWVSNQSCGVGVHKVTDAILQDLADKHPDAREASPDAIL